MGTKASRIQAIAMVYHYSYCSVMTLAFSPYLYKTQKNIMLCSRQGSLPFDNRCWNIPVSSLTTNHIGSATSLAAASESVTTNTESMRLQSLNEMERVMDFFKDKQKKPLLLSSQKEVSEYIDEHFDNILFDCDGVLYRGTDIIHNAPASLQSLMNRGNKKVFFVTNNASSSRKQLRDKLSKMMSCPDLKEEQMIGSAYSASRYLIQELMNKYDDDDKDSKKPRVHVIGSEGLYEEIRSAGFEVTGGPGKEGDGVSMSRDELEFYPFLEDTGERLDAMVIGLDHAFNYRKLCIANVLLQRYPEALLVATNKDSHDLVGPDGRNLPGNGSIVAAVEYASQRKAILTGKPSPILADLISKEHGLDPARTLMVGDRLDTDVRFGLDGGMTSALVLTGVTSAGKLSDLHAIGGTIEEPMPSIIFPHMGLMGL